jgi:hypothetical protein
MMPRYRTPDPHLRRHKSTIDIVALTVGVAGLLGLLRGPDSIKAPAVALVFVTFMTWIYLNGKITPRHEDVYQFLEDRAREDGHIEWLQAVERDFAELWGLDPEKGFTGASP